MKISKKLPQFVDDKTLLVVSGKQHGDFFIASNGIVRKIKSFKFTEPKYSDREGHFKQRGARGVFRSGAVYENKKDRIIIEITNQLAENIKLIFTEHDIDKVYIFAPSHLKNQVKNSFPKSKQNKIQNIYFGNYYLLHPFDLIKIIAEDKESKQNIVIPTKESAIKLLKR